MITLAEKYLCMVKKRGVHSAILPYRVSFRKLSKWGSTGGIWILRGGGGGGGMMVRDVIRFHKSHLVGWSMLECVCVGGCVCRVSYRILSFGRGRLQSSVLT